ncbi:MAG: T9SS type A sorting domain-containing protein [Chlorobi bacterium]|nr:T9SS type A sorting domain-containing protein [Chlorobiota bacterium]
MPKTFYSILFLCVVSMTFAQQQEYFNNIYQHGNNFAIGMTILETDDGYVGYGGTEEIPIFGQQALFYKIDKQGGETIWKSYAVTNSHYYYGNVGGAMVKTSDGNFVMVNTHGIEDIAATLFKVDTDLDTIWKRDYNVSISTIVVNCIETTDKGFMLVGWVQQTEEGYSDLLLLKTDSLGNYQWHKAFGDVSMAQKGTNVMKTPDGGYLIGGLNWDPPVYESLDAMVIKTDSLGNEEWTNYFGNPDVDDDMAIVTSTIEGYYLIATVNGEWTLNPYNGSRAGRMLLNYIDIDGNTIWAKKIGPTRFNFWIKNMRKTNDGYIITGFSFETDSVTFQHYSGWIMKLDNNLDSVWYRDYIHGDENWESFLYDTYHTSDNGYVAVGYSRPDVGGTSNKMWILKVDSMGCDTAGCATGVFVEELSGGQGEVLQVWPNPAKDQVTLSLYCPPKQSASGSKCAASREKAGAISIYDLQGIEVEEIKIPKNTESIEVDVSKYHKGIYYIKYIQSGRIKGTTKFIKQ